MTIDEIKEKLSAAIKVANEDVVSANRRSETSFAIKGAVGPTTSRISGYAHGKRDALQAVFDTINGEDELETE